MAITSFQDATIALDNMVDTHLGDEFELEVEGEVMTLRGTHANEEVPVNTESGEAFVLRRRLSVQERLLPRRLAERQAIIRMQDAYQPGQPTVTFRVIDVQRSHSGRVHIVLETQ